MSNIDDWLDYLTEGEARALLQELWLGRQETINGYGEAAAMLTARFMDTQHSAISRQREAESENAKKLTAMFPRIEDRLDEFIADVCASKASELNNSDEDVRMAFLLSHMGTVENVAKELEVEL